MKTLRLDTIANAFVVVIGITILAPRVYVAVGSLVQDHRQASEIKALWGVLTESAAPLYDTDQPALQVEFMDYQCPACRAAHAAAYNDARFTEDSIGVLHFPLPIHGRAREAALASICAQAYGEFLLVHRYLLSSTDWYAEEDWGLTMRLAGASEPARIVACMSSSMARDRLESDLALARRVGVSATPTFLTKTGEVFGGFAPGAPAETTNNASGR